MDWLVSIVAKNKSVTVLEPKIIHQCCIDTNNTISKTDTTAAKDNVVFKK